MTEPPSYILGQTVIVKQLALAGTIVRIASGERVRRWPYLVSVPGRGVRAYSADELMPVPSSVRGPIV